MLFYLFSNSVLNSVFWWIFFDYFWVLMGITGIEVCCSGLSGLTTANSSETWWFPRVPWFKAFLPLATCFMLFYFLTLSLKLLFFSLFFSSGRIVNFLSSFYKFDFIRFDWRLFTLWDAFSSSLFTPIAKSFRVTCSRRGYAGDEAFDDLLGEIWDSGGPWASPWSLSKFGISNWPVLLDELNLSGSSICAGVAVTMPLGLPPCDEFIRPMACCYAAIKPGDGTLTISSAPFSTYYCMLWLSFKSLLETNYRLKFFALDPYEFLKTSGCLEFLGSFGWWKEFVPKDELFPGKRITGLRRVIDDSFY